MSENYPDYRLPEELTGTILAEIVRAKMAELAGAKKECPEKSVRESLAKAGKAVSLKEALAEKSSAIIAEIKKASPSKGLLRPNFAPLKIAAEYRENGAAAISVITERPHFQGGLEILAGLRPHTDLPLLRKDFIIDPYQALEARAAGADAVLLIVALLEDTRLRRLREEIERLGMEALVEVHNEAELRRALRSGATLVGVNNRDLRTFEVSLDVSIRLSRLFPEGITAVAESGINTGEDIKRLAGAGYRGFLIGERFMRAESPGAALAELRSQCL
jgi:indole-3-glycerol phosphate synthase